MKQAARAILFRDNKLLVIKRDKFGKKYNVLVGGGVEMGESPEEALVREAVEETGLKITEFRLVFIEEAGKPYGTQYIYLCKDPGGEIALDEKSIEKWLNTNTDNKYSPDWLPLSELKSNDVPFRSDKIRSAILNALKNGWPKEPIKL